MTLIHCFFFFFFNDTATTEIFTLSLHDALPISFGAFTFVDGLLGVYSAIQGRDQMRHWWVLLLWGLAGVVVGVLTVVAPGVTALVMTLYIGAWALVTGLLQIVAAVRLRDRKSTRLNSSHLVI